MYDNYNGYNPQTIINQMYGKIKTIFDELNENDTSLNLNIQRIGIYGSRYTGTHKESSDLDVYLSYTGNMKEYALFNILHEEDIFIAGMKVDINPLRPEESGIITEFLNRYPKMKVKSSKPTIRTKL